MSKDRLESISEPPDAPQSPPASWAQNGAYAYDMRKRVASDCSSSTTALRDLRFASDFTFSDSCTLLDFCCF